MRKKCEKYISSCHTCQVFKKQRKKYGQLPVKKAETEPWQRVNVDLIGPYKVRLDGKQRELRAMTMIDPATGWFEIAPITEPNSYNTQRIFDSYWLARYPRPAECGFDNGSEFKGLFKELCQNYGIKRKRSTEYNPQGNSIVERVHQVVGNALRTFDMENQEFDDDNPFEEFLTATAYAIRSTYHTTLQASPAQLVFGRDMIIPLKFQFDWAQIAQRKQRIIEDSNKKENAKRIQHKYRIGDQVLITRPGIQPKLAKPRDGPYTVVSVYKNGTVCVQKGAVIQRMNIRRLTPYRSNGTHGGA